MVCLMPKRNVLCIDYVKGNVKCKSAFIYIDIDENYMKQFIKIKDVHHNSQTNNNNRNNSNIYNQYINIALKTNFENMNLGINLYTKSGDLTIHQSQNTHFRGYKELLELYILLNACTVWHNHVRKPQRGLPSFCCGFEKIIIVFNGKFVTEFAILKSNYSPMKRTQDMKLMTIIHYILLNIIR